MEMSNSERAVIPFTHGLNAPVIVDTDLELKKLELSAKRMDYHMKLATAVMQSGLAPKHFSNPQAAFVAIEYGVSTLNMEPMSALWNISVIQGKPSPSAASAIGACDTYLDEPHEYKYYDKNGTELPQDTDQAHKVVCLMKRKGKVFTGNFSLEDAQRAGLVKQGGGWEKYPKQMLEARSGMFAARKSCPNIFAGIYSTEEVQYFKPDTSSSEESSKDEPKKGVSAKDAILTDFGIPESKAEDKKEELIYIQLRKDEIEQIVDEDKTQLSYDSITERCRMKAREWEMSMSKEDWHDFCVFLQDIKDSYPDDVKPS